MAPALVHGRGDVVLTTVVGAPFSAVRIDGSHQQIERREGEGEVGLVALNYTSLYSALVPGIDSVYRDGRISDSGAARFAAYMLAVALREAHARELPGFVAVDSPRQAVQAVQQSPGSPVVEVTVTRQEALRRAQQHIALLRDLVPRAAADDGEQATQRCKKMVAIRTSTNATCYRLIRGR